MEYWYGGECASDSVNLIVFGVSMSDSDGNTADPDKDSGSSLPDFVFVNGEPEDVKCIVWPDTHSYMAYTWSIVTGDGDGTFDAATNGTEEANPILFSPTTAGTAVMKVEVDLYEDTQEDEADIAIIDVNISSGAINLETGQSTVVTANATPNPDLIGGEMRWRVDWDSGDAGDVSFDPAWSSDQETTEVTAGDCGSGILWVEYTCGGKTASDSVPIAIAGIEITSPAIVDLGVGDTTSLTATYSPSDGTLSWSIISGPGGTFSPDATDDSPDFTGTSAGAGRIRCVLTHNSKTYSDSIPCVVRSVSLSGPFCLVKGDSISITATTTPDVVDTDGVVTWSLDDGSVAQGSFNPNGSPTEQTRFTALTGGTGIVCVTYGSDTGQGQAEDSALVTVISVEISACPQSIGQADTAEVTATVLPALGAGGGTLTWTLLDSEGGAVSGNLFAPASSGTTAVSVLTADCEPGTYHVVATHSLSGVSDSDSQLITVVDNFTVIPNDEWIIVGETEHYQVVNASNVAYSDTDITWAIIDGGSRADIDTATGCVLGVSAGTIIVQAQLTGESLCDTAVAWVVDLRADLEDGFRFGSLHHATLTGEYPEWVMWPEKIGPKDPNWGLLKFPDVPMPPGPDNTLAHYELEGGTKFDAEVFQDWQWLADLINLAYFLIHWEYPYPEYTYVTLFNWVKDFHGITDQEIEKGLYWLTPQYTSPCTYKPKLSIVGLKTVSDTVTINVVKIILQADNVYLAPAHEFDKLGNSYFGMLTGLATITVSTNPDGFAEYADLVIDSVVPNDSGEGYLYKMAGDDLTWKYYTNFPAADKPKLQEDKQDLHPGNDATAEWEVIIKEVSSKKTLRIGVRSVFEHLKYNGKEQEAVDFVCDKYKLGLIGATYDNNYKDGYAETGKVTGKITLGTNAMATENICASVIGHETQHAKRSTVDRLAATEAKSIYLATKAISPGDPPPTKPLSSDSDLCAMCSMWANVEMEAHDWEVKYKDRTGILDMVRVDNLDYMKDLMKWWEFFFWMGKIGGEW